LPSRIISLASFISLGRILGILGGQSDNQLSPYYDAGYEDWATASPLLV